MGRAAIRHYANQPTCPLWPLHLRPNFTSTYCRGHIREIVKSSRTFVWSSSKNMTVYQVHVPVTQRPYTVHVPQNVPVNFVPVSVPTQSLGPISIVEQNPFTFSEYLVKKNIWSFSKKIFAQLITTTRTWSGRSSWRARCCWGRVCWRERCSPPSTTTSITTTTEILFSDRGNSNNFM